MAADNGKVLWSGIDFGIGGEPLAKDGLRKKRQQLEAIVAPYVTTRKTADEILFNGKRRYLTKPVSSSGKEHFFVVLALQYIYGIEAAWKAGDIDKVVRTSMGFATIAADLQLMEWSGVSGAEAAAFRVQAKRKRRMTREGNRELKAVPQLVLQSAYAEHRNKRDWLKRVTADVIRHRGGDPVSSKTVREELRIRGIVE